MSGYGEGVAGEVAIKQQDQWRGVVPNSMTMDGGGRLGLISRNRV